MISRFTYEFPFSFRGQLMIYGRLPFFDRLPQRIGNWSLTRPPQRLGKTGGRLVKHARYYWLLLAESHLTRRLFGAMVRRIELLPLPEQRLGRDR